MIEYIKTNWRTSIAGVITLVCVGLYLGNLITKEQLEVAIPTIMGIGFFASKG